MSNWKKGALHTHTFWSDGKSLPETAIHTYREELKFDFVCITDHNIFPEEKNLWIPVIDQKFDLWPPLLYSGDIDREKSLPNCNIEEKKVGVRRFVRLKTFDEIKEQWEIPGKFLLIGGCELSGGHYPGLEQACFDIHFNVLNCHKSLTPPERKENIKDTFQSHLEVCKEAIASSENDAIFMLNHPFWRYWDIDPVLVVENPEIRFMEICNDSADQASEPSPMVNTPEKYWDFILAHRLVKNYPVVYATATDDAHNYAPGNITANCGCNHGWVMVNCPGEMNVKNLISAMKSGDFYASNGVYLDKIDFDRDNRTLHVKVDPEDGVKYRIDFIVTKKDFSKEIHRQNIQHIKPRFNRDIPVVGDDVGITALTVDAIDAQYTMAEDDLYVRAEIISDRPAQFQRIFYPEYEKAWTQPFTGK